MNRYQVTKTIEFSYGHRLLNHNGKCRYLHGHNGMRLSQPNTRLPTSLRPAVWLFASP